VVAVAGLLFFLPSLATTDGDAGCCDFFACCGVTTTAEKGRDWPDFETTLFCVAIRMMVDGTKVVVSVPFFTHTSLSLVRCALFRNEQCMLCVGQVLIVDLYDKNVAIWDWEDDDLAVQTQRGWLTYR
jgi:hypothetical protein